MLTKRLFQDSTVDHVCDKATKRGEAKALDDIRRIIVSGFEDITDNLFN